MSRPFTFPVVQRLATTRTMNGSLFALLSMQDFDRTPDSHDDLPLFLQMARINNYFAPSSAVPSPSSEISGFRGSVQTSHAATRGITPKSTNTGRNE